jgi:hypothetical protein
MDAAIIGIGGAILGALTGAWITYWFSIKIAKRQVFNQAASSFRSTFTHDLTVLTTTPDDPFDILSKATADRKIAEAYFTRGLAYGKKGEIAKANGDFEKACELKYQKGCRKLKNPSANR